MTRPRRSTCAVKETLLAWHYTMNTPKEAFPEKEGRSFDLIMESGLILPFENQLIGVNEIPVAWFSLNQTWEQTVRKGVRKDDTYSELGMSDMISCGWGLYRIGIDQGQLFDFKEICRRARIPFTVANRLAKSGRAQGAKPWEWLGSIVPVPRSLWVSVETYNSGAWTSLTERIDDDAMRNIREI